MNIKKNKKTILTPAEIKNKDRSLLVEEDRYEDAFTGGIIIDATDPFNIKIR